MDKNIIRSHRVRRKYVQEMFVGTPPHHPRISSLDKEAFVEFFLLEDIVRLYTVRLKNEREKAYVAPTEQANELTPQQNIEKFSAIINLYNAAIDAARVAINSGDYKRVWKAVHEGALMKAAKNMKHLPELKNMGIELLRKLSDGMEGDAIGTIEEIARAAEVAIPDRSNLNAKN